MEEHMFKIQEVAYLHNISKKTLIYYDKIGLFRPQFVDESNGYRYYHRKEFPILKQIIYLKHIGFSLDEIKELLEHRCHETIITALEKRKAEVALALKQLEEVQQNIDYKLDFYHKTQHISENDLYRPSIKIIPERRICFFAVEQAPSKESIMLAYRKALRYLASKGLFSTQEYGSYVSNLDTDSNLQTYGSFISLPETCDIEHSKVLPAGKYIT
ncbi:MAG: MerR family transcriptional regulator, partial [Erysipelotrichaceae bacterium]